ncbi:3,4-dihydroxy-2-butanone-4-phosphate synthase [Gammaproteobacteria bacterium]|nr:3,4-dihydroxy-2-butanone-4-phosphate synthase [Gammaproteobacteria bacterium]
MNFNKVEELITDIQNGKMVILLDDEDRENEGDLVCASQLVTPEIINFMISKAKGLVCLTLNSKKCDELNLPMMTDSNKANHGTAFTVSIEAASGITTGISAADRSHTIRTAVAEESNQNDIVQPGHIFPLKAMDGGVLNRAGHTEAACDLSRLAGLEPSGVICEIMNDDGTMARRDDLMLFAAKHDLKIGTIADLIQYRAVKEKSITKEYEREVHVRGNKLTLTAWKDTIFGKLHLAFTKGNLSSEEAPIVRVHAPNLIHDLVGIDEFGSRLSFQDAIDRVCKEEVGVLLLIGNQENPDELIGHLQGSEKKWVPDTRVSGVGSQILRELGLKKIRLLAAPLKYPSLSGFDIEIVGFVK